MNKIHPLASVSPNAKLGDNIEIGPYAFIDDNVEIGDGCKILPHATIFSYVRLGKECEVFPGAVVGAIPQDLKFDGEVTYVEIGDRVTIRECATINRGTKASGKGVTRIGSDTLIMSYVHIAHDCKVGNHCILVSYVGLAGETDVDDWAIIGGGTKAHQFSKIGCHAMVGGASKVNKDIPPYSLCGREPIGYAGVNLVGLRRRGFFGCHPQHQGHLRHNLLPGIQHFRRLCQSRGRIPSFRGEGQHPQFHPQFKEGHREGLRQQ